MKKLSNLLRLEKFYILLIVELVFLLILPLLEINTRSSAITIAVGLSLILLAALNALEEKRKLKRASLLAFIAFILLTSLFQYNNHPLVYLVSFLIFFLLFVAADYSIMQSLMRAKEIKASSIAGSLAGYLMIGICFGFFIVTVSLNHMEPLSKSLDEIGFAGVLYFAYTTMTTIGYGDIVPIDPFVKMASTLIGVLSQFYIAVVVAIIIGKLMNARKPK